mgnify:CR=1 FL=1
MADNKVFILFEEIKTMLEGMKSRLEELPKVIDRRQPDGNDKLDLSPIKDAMAETARANTEQVKGLLARQWEAYAKASNIILRRIDYWEEELKMPKEQQEQQPQEHIHRHSFDIKSSKVSLSLWGWVCYVFSPCGATSNNGSLNVSMRTMP